MGESCCTKYPLLLVHGTGFRDRKLFGYWGRIPKALEKEGAVVYFGEQDSWASIEDNAAIVKETLLKIVEENHYGKVNIIAHSKGGLEMRYMISSLGMADKVASLTTISTPHRGSKTMSSLRRLPDFLFRFVSFFGNAFFRILGDKKPDFNYVCRQFTMEYAEQFNRENPDAEGVYYQSYTSIMSSLFSDMIMFWPHLLIYLFEGDNDGMVSPVSAEWTNFKGVLRGASRRGISHSDIIDLRRRKLTKKSAPGKISDIVDFYKELVPQLKAMGY